MKVGVFLHLELNQLQKSYGQTSVLKQLTLDLENHSSIGIIGSSGCGKSTLLRILSGIEASDGGKVKINGLSPLTEKEIFQEKIAVVFQQHNLFPHLTLERNISLILEKIKKLDQKTAKEKAQDFLNQLYLLDHKDKLPWQVSGGQAQRASIARALATEPELIFMDEPTAALDPQLSYEVLESVAKLKKQGIDFIFVTHEIKFLQNFADYFLFLHQGEILEQGQIETLTQGKTSELTAFLKPYFS